MEGELFLEWADYRSGEVYIEFVHLPFNLTYNMLEYPLKCAAAETYVSGYLNNKWSYNHALTS